MDNYDKEMIQAMAVIKDNCANRLECINCPMFDNCDDDNKTFPYYWYIPEV